jgi:hypothetical protein
MGQVCGVAGGEVVDAHYGEALAQQAVRQMRTKKSGGTGNKYSHGQRLALLNSKIGVRRNRHKILRRHGTYCTILSGLPCCA